MNPVVIADTPYWHPAQVHTMLYFGNKFQYLLSWLLYIPLVLLTIQTEISQGKTLWQAIWIVDLEEYE